MGKLTRRAEFLAANGGFRAPTPGFVLLVRPRGDNDPAMRLGLTVSRKVGNAVVRNRMRRRFRELARAILPEAGVAGADHVLIGRQNGIERNFAELKRELEKALHKVKERTARPELVEGRHFSSSAPGKKERSSTSSDQTDKGNSVP